MIAIDTNVLIRILVDDPQAQDQNQAARALAGRERRVFVALVTVVECVWVLETAYGLSREQVLDALEQLHNNSAFMLQDQALYAAAMRCYCHGVDFADGVIRQVAQNRALTLYTFDRRLARLEGVSRIDA